MSKTWKLDSIEISEHVFTPGDIIAFEYHGTMRSGTIEPQGIEGTQRGNQLVTIKHDQTTAKQTEKPYSCYNVAKMSKVASDPLNALLDDHLAYKLPDEAICNDCGDVFCGGECEIDLRQNEPQNDFEMACSMDHVDW